jgi:hypothetical protein
VQNSQITGILKPDEDEPLEDFKDRCLAVLKVMPMDLVLPTCLAEEHGRITKFYRMLKSPILYGPCFDTLTLTRIAFFELLYNQVFIATRKNIRTQAGRSIGRLFSYLNELHNPSFTIVEGGSTIPGRIIIMEDITVRIKLREAPQRPPKNNYCSDLSQVQHTLKTAEQVLEKLRHTARRIED